MSNYYWNEYMKHYVDNDLLLNTLKYHQRTVNRIAIQGKIDDDLLELCEANKIKVADIKLSVHEVKNSHVDKILKILNENYGRLEVKVSFPLIIFLNCKYGYKSGIYSYDFIKKKLLLIGDIKESIYNMLKEIEQSYDIIIPFYLNVV